MKSDAIIGAVEGVTKKWAKQRKAEERHLRPERDSNPCRHLESALGGVPGCTCLYLTACFWWLHA